MLPDVTWDDRITVVGELTQGLPEAQIFDLRGSTDTQRICAALVACPAPDPVTFVAHGLTCKSLPSVALSMRSQHRHVRAYVLIDPDLPSPSEGWPECPVSVVYTDDEQVSARVRLSGWDWVISHDSTKAVLGILSEER